MNTKNSVSFHRDQKMVDRFTCMSVLFSCYVHTTKMSTIRTKSMARWVFPKVRFFSWCSERVRWIYSIEAEHTYKHITDDIDIDNQKWRQSMTQTFTKRLQIYIHIVVWCIEKAQEAPAIYLLSQMNSSPNQHSIYLSLSLLPRMYN